MPAPATTMRAVRFEQFGDPATVLSTSRVPEPVPGPGEVLVRLRARPINPSDLSVVRGRYGDLPDLPATPGLESMGEVAALGEGARGVTIGQRVVPLGITGGSWAESVVVRDELLVPIPDAVSDATAAQLVVNPLTAWILLTEELDVKPGEWLMQSAAGSTLGRMVLQLAKARGFRTINLVRRDDQVAELHALGADEVLVGGDDLAARVAAITGEAGVTKAMDAVGGSLGGAMVDALDVHGTLISYGRLSQETLPLDTGRQIFRATTVRGFWLVHWFHETPPARLQQTIATVLGLMAEGVIDPPVEATYDLADIREAVAHAERAGRSGKVLLTG